MPTMWHNVCTSYNQAFETIKWRSTMQTQLKQTNSALDPVCGMTVNQRLTDIVTTIQGQTYYFCAEGCREAFVSDPQKYLTPAPPKKKGIWGRYLERLEKATGGKSMDCH
jgi:YHS domain-containing protein